MKAALKVKARHAAQLHICNYEARTAAIRVAQERLGREKATRVVPGNL
jgi:hypothetical protein